MSICLGVFLSEKLYLCHILPIWKIFFIWYDKNTPMKYKLIKTQLPNWQKYNGCVSARCTFARQPVNYVVFVQIFPSLYPSNYIVHIYCVNQNRYFWLRFGLANAINDYQRLRIRVLCVGKFFPLITIIELVITNLSFEYKITRFEFVFSCCEFTKVFFLFKKLVWNVCIKAFWYTNTVNSNLSKSKDLENEINFTRKVTLKLIRRFLSYLVLVPKW